MKLIRNFVIDFVEKGKSILNELQPSFFEYSFGMAVSYFAEHKVDVAVIETGMGGRLDSTNVVNPVITVITNIGFDHTQYLGNTLEKIAKEKAGIIKPLVPLVIGETQSEVLPVFIETAKNHQVNVFVADKNFSILSKKFDFRSSSV